ncbi:MAG: C1 family peptidase [Desulfomonilaceae bacterium]
MKKGLVSLIAVLFIIALSAMSTSAVDGRSGNYNSGLRLPNRISLIPEFQNLGLSPRAQGKRDTCSLFAITALAEFEYAKNNPAPPSPFSEEFLIWAVNRTRRVTKDQAKFDEAVRGLKAFGITSEEMMPYASTPDPGRKPSLAAIKDARSRSGRWNAYWIKRWDPKSPLREPQMLAIKKALASGHPVACGLRWPKSQKGHQLLEVPPSSRVYDGHSIVFVGYEDNPEQMGGGVYLFRNSMGPHWGNKGYGTMSYAYAHAYANDALWLQLRPRKSQAATKRFETRNVRPVRR